MNTICEIKLPDDNHVMICVYIISGLYGVSPTLQGIVFSDYKLQRELANHLTFDGTWQRKLAWLRIYGQLSSQYQVPWHRYASKMC